ncbi:MAG: hypothetical protein R3A10_00530 [Caldilineaceae bacterium]
MCAAGRAGNRVVYNYKYEYIAFDLASTRWTATACPRRSRLQAATKR